MKPISRFTSGFRKKSTENKPGQNEHARINNSTDVPYPTKVQPIETLPERQVETKLGRIAEYLDGLPQAAPKIKDTFEKGMTFKQEHRYKEAIDLFKQAIALEPNESQKACLLILIGNCFAEQNKLDEAEAFYKKVVSLAATKNGDPKALSTVYNNIGIIYRARNNYKAALEWYHRSIKTGESINDVSGLAPTYNNVGIVHKTWGNYDEALVWFNKSLKIAEKIGDSAGIAPVYNNIGIIHKVRSDFDKAMQWYLKSLQKWDEIGGSSGIATTYGNIGSLEYDRAQYDEAIQWFTKCLKIREELKDWAGVATTYNNIGNTYIAKGDDKNALEWYEKRLKIPEEQDEVGLANTYNNMGMIYRIQGDDKLALQYMKKALVIFRRIGADKVADRVKANIMDLMAKN